MRTQRIVMFVLACATIAAPPIAQNVRPASAAPPIAQAVRPAGAGPVPAQDASATARVPGVRAASVVALPDEDSPLWLVDMDADGDLDLVSVSADALLVWRLSATGSYPATADAVLPWPAHDVAWDLGDVAGDGASDVLLIVGGKRLTQHALTSDGAFGPARVLSEDVGAALPRGIHRVPFVRDVDAQGPLDLVIPGPGRFRILRAADGGLAPPIDVAFESQVRYTVGDPERLDARFGQDVTIPWFRMRDVDGDGRLDLVSETSDRVLFHIADPDLPAQPTWRLDLESLREEVRLEQIDFFNLTRNVSSLVTWRIEDIDGVPPHDIIVQQGSTLLIWLGGSRAGIDRNPDDVLPSSGNVLLYLLFDSVGDALPELHILRIEDLTLGEVVRMAVMSSETTLEIFSYRNRGGRFERKAVNEVRIQLAMPALLDMADDEGEMRIGIEASLGELDGPEPQRVCLDGDGVLDDLVVHEDGVLRFWRDLVPAAAAGRNESLRETLMDAVDETGFDGLAAFLRHRDDAAAEDVVRRNYTVSVRDLAEGAGKVLNGLRGIPRTGRPDVQFTSAFGGLAPKIVVTDLDGDGVSDVLLVHALSGDDGAEADEADAEGDDDAPPGRRTVQAVVLGTPPAPDDADG